MAFEEPFAGERTYAELVVERLRLGWTPVASEWSSDDGDEPRDAALEAKLAEDPSDEAASLVYADWLQQQGHPRGALIAVQHARETRPNDPVLAAEEARLFTEHRRELMGGLMDLEPKDDAGVFLEWERGFVRKVRIDGEQDRSQGEASLFRALSNPSTRMLRELEIGKHQWGDQNNTLMSMVLVGCGLHPPLRRLVLADFDDTRIDNIDISRAPLGDLGGLGVLYPRLEDVVLKGTGDVRLQPLALPNARRFALRTSSLRRETLRSILEANWPALEELELWFGAADYGADCTVEDLQSLFRGDALPKLRTLRLMNAEITDELCRPLLTSRLLPRLEALDFALGTLSAEGAGILIEGRAALGHLRSIGVFENSLPNRALDAMREAGLPIDDSPCADAGTERRQKQRRYVTVSE